MFYQISESSDVQILRYRVTKGQTNACDSLGLISANRQETKKWIFSPKIFIFYNLKKSKVLMKHFRTPVHQARNGKIRVNFGQKRLIFIVKSNPITVSTT